MIRRILFILLIAVPFTGFSSTHYADTVVSLAVANPLQTNMVVQQGKPFKVWGQAPAGKTVKISADWLSTITTVTAGSNNKFTGIINVPVIKPGDFTPHTITVESGTQKVTLTNLLIGDVWFCSGQSNMQFAMREVQNAASEIAAVNDPHVRILNVKFAWRTTPVDSINGKWAPCDSASVKNFSAIGYYYGQELRKKLNIPIGVIYSGVGGSVAQAYVAEDVLKTDTMLHNKYLVPFYNSDPYKDRDLNVFSFATTSQPYLIYNAMINPFFNLSIKGILWYQGESNRFDREEYLHLTYKMIDGWRKNFAQGSLPFYYVQVAPYAYNRKDPTLADYAFFRETQEKISRISNTAMVVTMDVGDENNIHPPNKKPVAGRLARAAFNRTYNMLDVSYLGPQYHHAEYSKNKAVVYFTPESVISGLKTTDGKAPKYFFMAGEDKQFYPAEAKMENNTIVLTCKQVKKPVAIRYAFTNYAVTNFENCDGLPAVPFRTDTWTEKQVAPWW